MITLRSFFLLTALSVLGCASRVAALEIVYPADKTTVGTSSFLVIKGGEQPLLDALVIEINGVASDSIDISSPEYRASFRDMLILQPEWDRGKNRIKVTGSVAGKPAATVEAEIAYLPYDDPSAMVPPGFKPFVMHVPEKEKLCTPCHNLQPTAAQLKTGMTAENNPCGSCHKRMLAKKFVHGPDGVFQCSDCHDTASKPSRWQVTKNDLVLCGECHDDKLADLKKQPYIHGPVAVGQCTICHDPHATDEPAQLHAPTNTLCLSCHVAVKKGGHVVRSVAGRDHPLDKSKDPLRPGRTLSCVSCHNPHSGENAEMFVRNVKSRFDLCQKCHQK